IFIMNFSSLLFFTLSLISLLFRCFVVFSFHAPTPTEIYTLSLHDALPIFSSPDCCCIRSSPGLRSRRGVTILSFHLQGSNGKKRSEEHTSELQSRVDLVCRLLLEKKSESTA